MMVYSYCMFQDEGVYEYIDEDTTSVDRQTLLNTPDVVLSANQNDTIHSAAIRQLGRVCDASRAVTLRGGSAGSSTDVFVDGDALLETSTDTPKPSDANEEEGEPEDEADHTNPFMKLLARIGPVKKRKAADGPTTQVPKEAKNNKRHREEKFRKRRAAPDEKPQPTEPVTPTPPTVPKEDQELLESYMAQLEDLQKLDASSSADTSFNPWAKTRQSKLNELKSGQCACVCVIY